MNHGSTIEIKGETSCDLWEALRKFSNEDVDVIARSILRNGPSTLSELRAQNPGLTTNELNHALIEMRNVELVKKIDKRYYITFFCRALIEALDAFKLNLSEKQEAKNPDIGIFEAISATA